MQHEHDAKKNVLQSIIEMMSQHQLSGLKKKGAPAVASLEVHAEPADLAEKLDGKPSSDTDEDESPDLMQKLMEMYGKGDEDESDDKAKLLGK